MAYTGTISASPEFLAQMREEGKRGLSLVFEGGCNLRCSWCAVTQRDERSEEIRFLTLET